MYTLSYDKKAPEHSTHMAECLKKIIKTKGGGKKKPTIPGWL